MRASITRCAVFAITILALSGCRGGAGSYSPWRWGRKNAAANMSTPSEGPALPSASAIPGNYGETAQAPTTPGYPDQTAAAYQPPGSDGQAAGYPGQPAGYNNVAPSGMPNAAPGGYGAMPNAAEAPAAVAAAPQNGLYNEGYGQAQVAPASTDQSAYQTPQGGAYQSPAAQGYAPPAQGYAPPAADPYAAGAQPPDSNYAQPAADQYAQPAADQYAQPQAESYAPPANGYAPQAQPPTSAYATPDAAGGGQYANDRYSIDAAQGEQSAADRYAASNTEPMAQPAAEQSQAAPYQPGGTSYNPGQTGYSPPGVAPYQVPGQPNNGPSPRRDPYYRPGRTSDYSTGAITPSAADSAADRYTPPPVGGANPTDRYAPQAGNY